jgi:hypothetical protein
VSNGCLLDRCSQGCDIWNDAFVKGFVPAKPEKVTENSSINLEEMRILFWDA